MPTNPTIATDSAAELHKLIGDDATATFENDPTFIDSNPTSSASSENLDEQRAGAGQEFLAKSATADDDEDDEDDELEDDDEDEDDVDDGVDEDDLEDDEDEDDDDEDDDLEDDDEDDDEEEDDADEVEASASSHAGGSEILRADGLLGYEDEAQDVGKGVDRVTGDVERKREEARVMTDDPNENPDDAYAEVDPTAVRDEEDDSDVVIRPVKPMDLGAYASA